MVLTTRVFTAGLATSYCCSAWMLAWGYVSGMRSVLYVSTLKFCGVHPSRVEDEATGETGISVG